MEIKKEQTLPTPPETIDNLFAFYKYLIENDISFDEYADNLRQTCKYICEKKHETFIDLDQEVDEITDTISHNTPILTQTKESPNLVKMTYDPNIPMDDDDENESEGECQDDLED